MLKVWASKRYIATKFLILLSVVIILCLPMQPINAEWFDGQYGYKSVDSSVTTGTWLIVGTSDTSSYQSVSFNANPPKDISNSPSSKSWGIIEENSTYYVSGGAYSNPVDDGECTFTITNNDASNAVKIQIKTTDATGGVGWVATTDVPSANEFKQVAVYSGQNPASGIALTTSYQDFIASIAGGATKKWDYSLTTGTFSDGIEKSWTVTISGIEP